MPNIKNKIKYGLSNVYYSAIIGNTYTAPKAINGAVALALSQVGNSTPIYADNVEYMSITSNQGYDGTIEFVLLPDDFKIDILGETLDNNGIQSESANSNTPVEFALLFQFEGDAKNKRHVLYRCRCTRPNIESSTKGEKDENKNEVLNISVRPRRSDKAVKSFTTVETEQDIYDRWYTGVYPDLIPSLTLTSVAAATGTTTITVSPVLSGTNTYVYKTGSSLNYPVKGEECTTANGWTTWDGSAAISAINGDEIIVVEITPSINANPNAAVKAGKITAVIG